MTGEHSFMIQDLVTQQGQLEPVLVCGWAGFSKLGHNNGPYQWFATRADFASPRDTWQCLDIFLVVTAGGCFWLLLSGDAIQPPPVYRIAPHKKELCGLKCLSAKVKTFWTAINDVEASELSWQSIEEGITCTSCLCSWEGLFLSLC